jgi:hypothetical protein
LFFTVKSLPGFVTQRAAEKTLSSTESFQEAVTFFVVKLFHSSGIHDTFKNILCSISVKSDTF